MGTGAAEIIIGTESGVVERLRTLAPEKRFYPLTGSFICSNMKKTKLSDVLNALENGEFEITLPAAELEAAKKSLERMVEAAL